MAVQFLLLYYTEDRSTNNRLAEGLNIAKGRNTAMMASGQNSQKQWKSVEIT